MNSGAAIVNDISAGSMDKHMIETVAQLKAPYILMHMKGTPQTMQQNAVYENVNREVLDFFIAKTNELRKAGVLDIIIDPTDFLFWVRKNKIIGKNAELFVFIGSRCFVKIKPTIKHP